MQFHPTNPLSQSLPQVLHKIRSPKEDSPQAKMHDMVSPQWTYQNFLGYIVLDIQHKTLPQFLPCKLYAFKDFTSPNILLSYPTSSRFGIVVFTVPNEAQINFPVMIDTITNSKTDTFIQCIEDIPHNPHNSSDYKVKPIIKQHFQDHSSTVTPSQYHWLASFQDNKQPIAPFQDHKV